MNMQILFINWKYKIDFIESISGKGIFCTIFNSLFLICLPVLHTNKEMAMERFYSYMGWDAISKIFQTVRAPIDRIRDTNYIGLWYLNIPKGKRLVTRTNQL